MERELVIALADTSEERLGKRLAARYAAWRREHPDASIVSDFEIGKVICRDCVVGTLVVSFVEKIE